MPRKRKVGELSTEISEAESKARLRKTILSQMNSLEESMNSPKDLCSLISPKGMTILKLAIENGYGEFSHIMKRFERIEKAYKKCKEQE